MNTVQAPVHVYRGIALVHRWLGFTLFLVCLGGTASTMSAIENPSVLEGFPAVLALEAGGGGPVNEPPVVALIVAVAALGAILLVRGFIATRHPFRAPRALESWVRLGHRLLGAAFTVSLVVYLAVRATGTPPGAAGWVWVLLLLTVNAVGFLLFGVRLARRLRAKRRPTPHPRPGRPTTVVTR